MTNLKLVLKIPVLDSSPKCQEWPSQNPITDDLELEWLSKKVKEVHTSLDAAIQEALIIDSSQKKKKPNWDFISWLQYIHCLTDESLHESFFQSTSSLTRADLDVGTSHTNHPPTFHEGVVRLYNNPSFPPLSENITHPFFMTKLFDLLFENAQGELVDAVNSKTQFATINKNIATMHSKWLICGNGEGQRQNNDECNIKQCNIPDTVLLDGGKANFLHDLHPYHLYAWELFKKTDMMDGAMGMLDGSTTASGITTPGEDSWGTKHWIRNANVKKPMMKP